MVKCAIAIYCFFYAVISHRDNQSTIIFINDVKFFMKLREMLRNIFSSAGLADEAKQKVEAEIAKIPDVEIKEAEQQQQQTGGTGGTSTDLPPNVSPEIRALVQSLSDQNKALDAKLTDLIAEKDKNAKTLEERAKAEFADKVKKEIADAIAAGKIPAKDTAKQERFTKLLTANFEETKAIIAELPNLTRSANGQSQSDSSQSQSGQQKTPIIGSRNQRIMDYVNNTLKEYSTN